MLATDVIAKEKIQATAHDRRIGLGSAVTLGLPRFISASGFGEISGMGNSNNSSLCLPDQKETIFTRLRKLSQGSVSNYGKRMLW